MKNKSTSSKQDSPRSLRQRGKAKLYLDNDTVFRDATFENFMDRHFDKFGGGPTQNTSDRVHITINKGGFMHNSDIFYSLTNEDIQRVAQEALDRHLSQEEIRRAIPLIESRIVWHDIIESVIRTVVRRS